MKRLISQDIMLAYPQFDKPFVIYTDASNEQLGAVIMQDERPIAYYSRKLIGAEKNYTTGEQEILSIVETLKSFKTSYMGIRL